MMNTKLSQHMIWHCAEKGRIETILTIPHPVYVIFMSASLCCGSRLIAVYCGKEHQRSIQTT